jgi:hypothetical protein
VATAAVAVEILDRTPTYHPWLRSVIAVGAAVAAAGLLAATYLRQWRVAAVAATLAAASLLAAPAAFALSTSTGSSSGPIPSAGPSGGGLPGGGGPGGSTAASGALIGYLEANREGAEYLVAAFGSQASAPIIIASGQPVITIGGFNGGDPAPTLAQFEQLVAQHKVRYILIGGGGFGGSPNRGGAGSGNTSISQWVTTNGTQVAATSYGGNTTSGTLYRLF